MNPVKLKNNIYWVGAIDWDLRNFHGYLTQRGSTYNSYLIVDEKVVLIDTVKRSKYEEMLERIGKVVDPRRIDYLVINHVEMDHSGALPCIMDLLPNATIITSPHGRKGLLRHFKREWRVEEVSSGDSLSTGTKDLRFILTPMVHWPDSMMTYDEGSGILFSNDAFGQHLATYERFDDEIEQWLVMEEAKKYYANIVLSYGKQVCKALEAVSDYELELIAPAHGIIWRSYCSEITAGYHRWANNRTSEKAIIVYDTMWNSTRIIAETIYRAFEEEGVKVTMANLATNHISDIMTELVDAKYICVGSPTLNNNMLPTVAAFLTYLKGLAPKERVGLAFGSYGWGGQSIDLVEDTLRRCRFDLPVEKIKVNYIPDEKELDEIKRRVKTMLGAPEAVS